MTVWRMERELRDEGMKLVAGVDEAGRGPLCGPVVAAAFIPREIGKPEDVKDSKQLSESKREELYPRVLAAARAYGVGVAYVREIDEINILEATKLAMRRALRALGCEPELALVDGLHLEGIVPCRKVIHGDARVGSIAAASIIAKVTRDALMRALGRRWPGYGLEQNKGYGTPQHLEALRQLGPTQHHRLSFNGVRQPKLML